MTASNRLPIAELDAIGLADLDSVAALQTRKDRKYLVLLPHLAQIIERANLEVLEIDGRRTFRYESVYFDTPDHISYLAAAHRRRRRFKVRTRSYLDSNTCLLEVKTREHRGLTVKHRFPHEFENRHSLSEEALDFIDQFDVIAPVGRALQPSLTTRYQRTTLLETNSTSRITVDTDLECVATDGSSVTLPRVAVVETKTGGRPCLVDHLLWEIHRRPAKISKYGTGLAALTPALPANKWNRVLREYFGWSPRPGSAEIRRHSRPLPVGPVAPIIAKSAACLSHSPQGRSPGKARPLVEGVRP